MVNLTVRNNRVIPNAMEPRAAVAEYDDVTDAYTLYTTSQNPHLTRLVIGAFMLNIPESNFRSLPLMLAAASDQRFMSIRKKQSAHGLQKTQRPVKWTADRTQAFLSDAHGRDHINTIQVGLDDNNRIVGLRVDTLANLGSYLSAFAW